MEFNFIDFGIMILVGFAAINGFRKGFIGSMVGFFGSIIALVLAIKLYRPFAGLLNAKFGILAIIHSFLANHLPLPQEVSAVPINGMGSDLLIYKISNMALPGFIKTQIIEQAQEIMLISAQLGLTTIGEVLIFIVAKTLLNGLALIILWVLLTNLLHLTGTILSKSLDNTLLGGINRLGGLIVGMALNCLGLMVFFGIFTLFLEVTSQANSSSLVKIGNTVNQSVLVPYFIKGYELLLSRVLSFI